MVHSSTSSIVTPFRSSVGDVGRLARAPPGAHRAAETIVEHRPRPPAWFSTASAYRSSRGTRSWHFHTALCPQPFISARRPDSSTSPHQRPAALRLARDTPSRAVSSRVHITAPEIGSRLCPRRPPKVDYGRLISYVGGLLRGLPYRPNVTTSGRGKCSVLTGKPGRARANMRLLLAARCVHNQLAQLQSARHHVRVCEACSSRRCPGRLEVLGPAGASRVWRSKPPLAEAATSRHPA